jgi:hypothetical protein
MAALAPRFRRPPCPEIGSCSQPVAAKLIPKFDGNLALNEIAVERISIHAT